MISDFLFKKIYKNYTLFKFFSRFKWFRFRAMLEIKSGLFFPKPGIERIYLQRNGKVIDIIEFPSMFSDESILQIGLLHKKNK